MKPGRLFLTIATLVIATAVYSQQISRGDVCQNIPGLSAKQQKKMDELGKAHQKKMDQLRTRFFAEVDPVDASNIKAEMNAENKDHYLKVSALLTPEQQQWFDQSCNAYGNRGNLRQGKGSAYGRGMGRGMGRNCGRGMGRGYSSGSGANMGRGMGRGSGRGSGRGYGYR